MLGLFVGGVSAGLFGGVFKACPHYHSIHIQFACGVSTMKAHSMHIGSHLAQEVN